ncbi:MAG: M13 family metallopeptidase [Bacteroidota bacterium]
MKNSILMLLALFILGACMSTTDDAKDKEMPPGLDVTMMGDADPRKDFYRFANGNWLDKTKIPADEGRWGGFPELREKNDKIMLDIMDRSAQNPDFVDGSDERKAIDFFAVGMDSIHSEQVGTQPINKWIEKINTTSTTTDLQNLLVEMHQTGYDPFYGVSSFANLIDSKINSLYVTTGGLGLPNRDYYTKEDEKSREIREKYVAHIGRMMTLMRFEDEPDQMAADAMEIENRLALASLTPIGARNIPALYNPMDVNSLQELSPAIDWKDYLNKVGVDMSKVDTLIVLQPKFMKEVSATINELPINKIKNYLKWNVVNQQANFLHHEVVQANFDFYGKVIRGTEQMRPRSERVLSSTNNVIGEAIGKVYVAETFPPEAKSSAEEMVTNLMKAFDKRIKNLEWMSEETKEQALKKLNNLTVKIGYPNKWRDYSTLQVESSGEQYSYMENMENAWRWEFSENIKEIGEPVDRQRWAMNPQTVNAYFNPLNNEIVFPAAILQPPFYNYTADPAMNYGGIGAVIGHEISHGFDDQGSRFDFQGNMVNWWKEEDKKRFDSLSQKLIAQYDAYEALDSVFVQGKLTLGENIGDLGGLNAAYDGLQIHLEENGNPGLIDGFTPEQRLFISWATIWRMKYRDETLRTQVLTDPHSPGMFRAVGPLSNMVTFYAAFDVQEGDELWKPEAERVIIW